MEQNIQGNNDDPVYRELLFFKACAAVMALPTEEKRRLLDYVLDNSPALRGQ